MRRIVASVVLLALLAIPALAISALAVEPDEMLKNPVLEARARTISKSLRCLVCQNQSIDDSNADLARDLRILVRQRLVAGDSNKAVVAYIVARYGDFVLLKPPFEPATWVLWLGPAAVLMLAFGGMILYLRRRAASATEIAVRPLSKAERKRLSALLDEGVSREHGT